MWVTKCLLHCKYKYKLLIHCDHFELCALHIPVNNYWMNMVFLGIDQNSTFLQSEQTLHLGRYARLWSQYANLLQRIYAHLPQNTECVSTWIILQHLQLGYIKLRKNNILVTINLCWHLILLNIWTDGTTFLKYVTRYIKIK